MTRHGQGLYGVSCCTSGRNSAQQQYHVLIGGSGVGIAWALRQSCNVHIVQHTPPRHSKKRAYKRGKCPKLAYAVEMQAVGMSLETEEVLLIPHSLGPRNPQRLGWGSLGLCRDWCDWVRGKRKDALPCPCDLRLTGCPRHACRPDGSPGALSSPRFN